MASRIRRSLRAEWRGLLSPLAGLVVTCSVVTGCIPFGEEPPPCISDLDCPSGTCIDGVCVAPPDMDAELPVQPDFEAEVRDAAVDPMPCETGLPGACDEGRWTREGCIPLYAEGELAETCELNGLDEDCDRKTDEVATRIGEACVDDGAQGACRMGTRACAEGVLRCVPGEGGPESCDGIDNDCDGATDEHRDEEPLRGVGEPCRLERDTAVGGCHRGTYECPPGGDALRCRSIGIQEEVCNGIDDDCDGKIDELPPGAACVPTGAQGALTGLCHRGRELCIPDEVTVDGEPQPTAEMKCIPWLPSPSDWEASCNLVDDDCDGAYDEAGEAHVLEQSPDALPFDPAHVAALRALAPRIPDDESTAVTGPVIRPAAPDESDAGPIPHPCVDAACAAACLDAPAQGADDYRTCLQTRGCLGAPGVTEWRCSADSVCTVAACERYYTLDPEGEGEGAAPRCRPLEICNNGEDEDGDGLIDASVADPEACAARIDAQGRPNMLGACRGAACGDVPPARSANPDEYCWSHDGDECPRRVTLSYPYAIDDEEVSLRAYLRCVEQGYCTEPALPYFDRLDAWGEAHPPETRPGPVGRPLDGQRNVHTRPVSISGRGHAVEELLDVPATGVTWCQARRYCAWAGKRLPTEFEWERAAVGADVERRHFPWGDELPPSCPLDACCVDDWAGDPPALCRPGAGTRTCGPGAGEWPDAPGPDGLQTWPAGYGMFEGQCVEQLAAVEPGLFPVWSFPAGATPEGVRNMAGNAGEWVYDRMSYQYGTTGTDDPIGAGCMPPIGASEIQPGGWLPALWGQQAARLPEMRMFRGGMFKNPNYVLRGTNRMPMFPATPAPFIGFRCVRTLSDDGVCLADLPGQQQNTRNDVRTRLLEAGSAVVDCAPDFHTHDAHEVDTCPGGQAAPGGLDCADRQRECAAVDAEIQPPGCGAYVLSSLRLDFDRLILPPGVELRGEAVGLLEAFFASALAPAGGSSYLVLDLDPAFHLTESDSPVRFGTAYRSNGQLHWIGLDADGTCQPQAVAELSRADTLDTCCDEEDPECDNQQNIQICAASEPTTGRLMLNSLPVGVALSNVDISIGQGEFRARERVIRSGSLSFYINRRVAPDAWFGDPALRSDFLFTRHMNLPEIDLCPLAGILPGCGPAPGCVDVQGFSVCPEGEAECRGYFLPLSFEAVRLDRAIEDGLVGGLGEMRCPEICQDG